MAEEVEAKNTQTTKPEISKIIIGDNPENYIEIRPNKTVKLVSNEVYKERIPVALGGGVGATRYVEGGEYSSPASLIKAMQHLDKKEFPNTCKALLQLEKTFIKN